MRPYAHRDDYYILAMLTDGSAALEVDFERIQLKAGDILIVSPWQVHRKPSGEQWCADGWMLAFSPEFLTEREARAIEEYSISPHPLVGLSVGEVNRYAELEPSGIDGVMR